MFSKYFGSNASNPASSGVVRLASGDSLRWRNNANNADIALAKDTSDNLTYGGTAIFSSTGTLLASGAPALTGDVTSSAGSLTTTVAKIQGTTVSGTTGSGNVVFSASPTFTGTTTGATLALSSTATASAFISTTANPASAGAVRLASTDSLKWRNNANGADIALAKDTSDQLSWAGTSFLSSSTVLLAAAFPALTGDVTTSAGSLSTTISAGAVSLSKMANLAANSVIGNSTGLSATPTALTLTAVTVPAFMSISGGSIVGSGGAITFNSQTQGLFLASPAASTGAPAMRAIVGSDLPNPSSSTLGGVQSVAAQSSKWINSISTSGVPSLTQPAFSDLSGNIATGQMNSGTGASSLTFWRGDGTWATPAGGGTVTSFTDNSGLFSVATATSTPTTTYASQTANTVLAAPNGSNGAPSFRTLVAADIPALAVVSKNASYTIVAGDLAKVIFIDTTSTAVTLTLPAPSSGFHFWVKDKVGNASTNNITIAQHSTETIEGLAASYVVAANWAAMHFISDGTNWYII